MKKNIFGTDGIRGPMGIEPFTQESIIKLGLVIGQWAVKKYGTADTQTAILLGHDTRQSCSFVKAALQTGLLLNNVSIHDAYIVPTPALLQHIARTKNFNLGIIISASHNHYHDNGIKIVDIKGKLSLDDELIISQMFYDDTKIKYDYDSLGSCQAYHQLQDTYRSTISSYFPAQFLSGVRIVLDYAHGATYKVARTLFTDFGATLISINDSPNGKNINENCGALHLESLQHAVLKNNAHIGFAFDGDGDRVIAVDRHGIVKNGDDILALLMHHPRYKQQQKIVGTVMSNQGFQVYVQNQGKQLIRTHVGDKYIAQLLEKDNLIIGGEQSGHIILRDYLNTGDGIFTALRVLESIIGTNNWDMITFSKYPQVLINVPIAIKKDLTLPFFKTLIEQHESQLHGGRLLVRYSGTESLVRVMVEDVDLDHAQLVAQNVSKELAKQLS